jgi:hypothetical protein
MTKRGIMAALFLGGAGAGALTEIGVAEPAANWPQLEAVGGQIDVVGQTRWLRNRPSLVQSNDSRGTPVFSNLEFWRAISVQLVQSKNSTTLRDSDAQAIKRKLLDEWFPYRLKEALAGQEHVPVKDYNYGPTWRTFSISKRAELEQAAEAAFQRAVQEDGLPTTE